MKKIIPPVDRELLKAELNPDRTAPETNCMSWVRTP